jgi:tRNA uridine 5-carboxymethylaminomethyl modification enzyme
MFQEEYDVIVVGAGHAGSEAAAAANLGSKPFGYNEPTEHCANVLQLHGRNCKGKSEIDALGGYSGIVSDRTAIQFKMLNKSKGPAMWSPRVQSDRMRFAEEWRLMLEGTPNLDFTKRW